MTLTLAAKTIETDEAADTVEITDAVETDETDETDETPTHDYGAAEHLAAIERLHRQALSHIAAFGQVPKLPAADAAETAYPPTGALRLIGKPTRHSEYAAA